MKTALAEKVGGYLRSGVESPDRGVNLRCRAVDVALAVVIAAVPLAFSPLLAPVSLKWAILGIFTPLVVICWLWGGCGRPFRPLPKLIAPLLTLLVVSELSLLQAINLYYGLQQIAFFLVLFLLYLVVAYSCAQPERQPRLIRYLVLTLLAVSVFSLYGCTMGSFLAPLPVSETLFRLFGNTNYGAAYLLTVIPFSVALYLNASRPWEWVVWGTTLFFSTVLLTLSMVRGAWASIWIGLVVVAAVFLWGEGSGGRRTTRMAQMSTLLIIGGGVFLALALWPACLPGEPAFGERLASAFDPTTESLQVRQAMWHGTLRMIWDHLSAGVGAGNFALAFVPYRSASIYRSPGIQVEHPHNEFLHAGAELGFLGLLALLWLVCLIVRMSWRVASGSGARKEVVAGIVGGLAASAAYANLFYVAHVPASAVNLAILLGMLDGMDHEVGHKERRQPIRLTYLLPSIVALGLLSVQYFLRPAVGEIFHYRAERDFQASRVEDGLRHLERSIAWNPQSHEVRYRRAAILFEMERYPETIREAGEALHIHPNLDIAYGLMGSAYLKLGEKAKAKEIFQHALALNPNYPHALNNLGALAAQAGRIDEAAALFVRAMDVMGQREMSPYANLGNIYEIRGRIREALRMHETAAAIKPRYSYSWYTVARLRVLSGDLAGAYVPLARAIALDGVWRARAAHDTVFEAVRQDDLRVRILLRLE